MLPYGLGTVPNTLPNAIAFGVGDPVTVLQGQPEMSVRPDACPVLIRTGH